MLSWCSGLFQKAIASASALPVQPKAVFIVNYGISSHQEVISNSLLFRFEFSWFSPRLQSPLLRQLSQALLPPGRPFTVIQQKQSRSKQAQPAQDRKGPPDTDRIYQILQK
jgi:hypothetical protein